MSNVNVPLARPKITPIAAFDDNYIWAIVAPQGDCCWVVDPGDAAPVLAFLAQNNLTLAGVLITHHHSDHTGGIQALKETFGSLPVYGPANPAIKGITRALTEEGEYRLEPGQGRFALECRLFKVPGHTLDHIAYLIGDALFCGDTLFCAGCGRLFEGSAEQMYHSLSQFAALDDNTKVYCTHEYTLANLRFAKAVEPDNQALADYQLAAEALREQQQPTLPSTIGREKAINPFMRCQKNTLQNVLEAHSGHPCHDPVSRFAVLRQWKDNF
ncbi:hydroxyacylglutathione hydrolase [Shewanella algae]|uniref:hydroxyacylglutathione hydrolase n=1 Tax=Shewanella algae TaxID=38313 RepID=UPI000D14EFEF|nr:hydroxyacylglutathione hydrolase [Shewanella algae]PST68208.1 hydroxyacylglutathione hydrolase [Shewanella algae]QTE84771.1 hydroxyacylglutathione hydrolase [Shewanella algae]